MDRRFAVACGWQTDRGSAERCSERHSQRLSGRVPGTSQQSTRQNIIEILGFEDGTPGEFPAGWRSNNPFDATVDKDVVHGGKYSARFERKSSSIGVFTDLFVTIPVDFEGQAIELRVFAKTENVAGQVIMSLRESSGSGPSLELNSWQLPNGEPPTGRSIVSVCPAIAAAKLVSFQLYMNGTGKVWFDDLQLFVDGRPIADALGGIPSGIPSAQPVPRQQSSEILGLRMARLVCSLRAGAPTALGWSFLTTQSFTGAATRRHRTRRL